MGIDREQRMSKLAKAKLDDQLAMESRQFREQKIYNNHAGMEAIVYRVEKVRKTKRRKFQVRLNRARC